jgi:hypothetical protein
VGRRIVERALPKAVQAEDLFGRDLQGDHDVLQLAALVEHLERLGSDLTSGHDHGLAGAAFTGSPH